VHAHVPAASGWAAQRDDPGGGGLMWWVCFLCADRRRGESGEDWWRHYLTVHYRPVPSAAEGGVA